MATKICAYCGQLFEPRPQVPNQAYCSLPKCQQARRLRWHRTKMESDPDYRENQARSQRAWMDRHPGYWHSYRKANPKQNRQRQQSQNKSLKEMGLAKMDVSSLKDLQSGLYRITLISNFNSTCSNGWIAEITPICIDCPCKKDACKDRT